MEFTIELDGAELADLKALVKRLQQETARPIHFETSNCAGSPFFTFESSDAQRQLDLVNRIINHAENGKPKRWRGLP